MPYSLPTGLSSSFQNFVQIISNLLVENWDKWQEARLVRAPVWGPWSQSSRMSTGVPGAALSPRPDQGVILGSNPSTASASLVMLRKLLILLSSSVPICQEDCGSSCEAQDRV